MARQTRHPWVQGPIPACAGIGLRSPHYDAVLAEHPAVAWWEVHSENLFAPAGKARAVLERVRREVPVSFHGVGLSLGSTDPLDRDHLRRLQELVRRYEPALVSEHCAWGGVGGMHFHDLLPLPYTEEALAHLVARVQAVQDTLGRELLVENPSTYLRFAASQIPEQEFLVELARRSGCRLLLDVNNVHVQARNHGFDAAAYLAAIPAGSIAELHLAGHSVRRFAEGGLLIDTHNAPVSAAVWALYDSLLQRIGPRPTLIEWDRDLPALEVLQGEAARADARLREVRHARAS